MKRVQYFWHWVTVTIIIVLLVACGSLPLAQPENLISTEQSPTSSSTLETTEKIPATKPAPSPIVTEIKEETKITSIASPTPSPIPIITQEAVTESSTEPTKTPVVNTPPAIKTYDEVQKEGGITVDGYTFSLPKEVPDGIGPVQIVGWLPDSPDEIVAIAGYQVVAINVYTGQIREFSQPSDYPISPGSVTILKNDLVTYRTYDPEVKRATNIWVSGADDKQATAPVSTKTSTLAPIVTPKGDLIFYDIETIQAQTLKQNGVSLQADAVATDILTPLALPEPANENEAKPKGYRATSIPNSHWTAFDNGQRLILIDLETGESKEIPWNPQLRADTLYWSPDGQKLAMLVTEGPRPIPYMKLFVLDVNSEQFQEIETDFQYITNVAWATDNEYLLITAQTGIDQNDFKISDLFLIDISSNEIRLVPILPEDTYVGFSWKLLWASDGQKIVIGATFAPGGNPQLYRIDIGKP